MASRSNKTPLIVIVGPTASGKTALAIELAQKYNGEIICADSRTVYKGMDIGTAKPTTEERALVPHWGLDLVEPGEHFSAADFKHYAVQKIEEIHTRGHTPFLVGGTGLYVDGVILDYQFGQPASSELRAHLESLTIEELQNYCRERNIKLPENDQNKRYLIRAIEQNGINNSSIYEPIDGAVVVGIATENDRLRQRIAKRADAMFADNKVVQEATNLAKKFGWKNEAMTGNVYKLIHQHLEGDFDKHELVVRFATADWHLAKRQLTWFKRRKFITWLPLDGARTFLESKLSSI